ncbi:adenine deaminase [Pelosinus sp. UFO1]|uniref:adenine deaminase n=1 Tax=Pelosinus sp. UFO1 TaxID=484770 RepID=UPI0004D14368|nr:adenine deaminase [Pelosinus sp. UFO1]AIF51390.1 Adenine deaminase [Pelosinus sp. UFO1]
MKPIEQLISVAQGHVPADVVLKNAQVFNVFTGKFDRGDVAVVGGYIAGIGQYEGQIEIDMTGKFITPGFIDGHVHMESSMVSPREFAKVVVTMGTTTLIVDPHEIANVVGEQGIEYVLDVAEELPVHIFIMLPSCVPATNLETSGANLTVQELARFINHSRVLGLGELMDFPGVLRRDKDTLAKIRLAEGKLIDGHGPELSGNKLTAYIAAGIGSDHECVTPEEAIERVRQGMYIMLREGSAAKNLLNLLPMVNGYTARRCMFATDDRHPADLINQGHINHMVKMSIDAGIDLATVLQIATINPATYFNLKDIGAIAPGYYADLLVFDDLISWVPTLVYKEGQIVATKGKSVFNVLKMNDKKICNTMHLGNISPVQLKIKASSRVARVIGLIPHQLITASLVIEVPVINGEFVPDRDNDILKLAVFERHHGTGNVGVGLVKGLGMSAGAIASTVAHDSHNVVVIGSDDDDMIMAVQEVEKMHGGIAIVNEGKVLGTLALPLAGLMSEEDLYTVHIKLTDLHNIARGLGVNPNYDPFMTLAFMSLPVIPSLKLTDKGLVDVNKFAVVPVSI